MVLDVVSVVTELTEGDARVVMVTVLVELQFRHVVVVTVVVTGLEGPVDELAESTEAVPTIEVRKTMVANKIK